MPLPREVDEQLMAKLPLIAQLPSAVAMPPEEQLQLQLFQLVRLRFQKHCHLVQVQRLNQKPAGVVVNHPGKVTRLVPVEMGTLIEKAGFWDSKAGHLLSLGAVVRCQSSFESIERPNQLNPALEFHLSPVQVVCC